MEKKGFVFTLISILFVSVILIAFLIQATNVTRVKTEEARVKVETVNAFLKSIKSTHINNAIKASAGRAFDAMIECILVQGGGDNEKKLYENSIETFSSIMTTASIGDQGKDKNKKGKCDQINNQVIKNTMSKDGIYNQDENLVTLSNTLKELIDAADKIGLVLDFNIPDTNKNLPDSYIITVSQSEPWNIDINIPLSFTLKTKDGSISWQVDNFQANAKISIIGLKDPLYAAFDDKRVLILKWEESNLDSDLKKIVDYPKFNNPVRKIGDLSGVAAIPPTYMERLSQKEYLNGKLTCNNIIGFCGIETLKDPKNVQYTWVDYLQYQKNNIPGGVLCNNVYYNVRLDAPHQSIYGCQVT